MLRRDLPMTAYVVASASAGWAVTYFLFANEWLDDRFQDYLGVTLEPALAPLMAVEQFGAGRVAP